MNWWDVPPFIADPEVAVGTGAQRNASVRFRDERELSRYHPDSDTRHRAKALAGALLRHYHDNG